MEGRSIGMAVRSFERLLFELDALLSPQCDKLLDTTVRHTARTQIVGILCSLYTSLYEAIMDPTNLYEDPASLIHYKPEQMKTMLGA